MSFPVRAAFVSSPSITTWDDLAVGQRVRTIEGHLGVITDVDPGPLRGGTTYTVRLDQGLGGGSYGLTEVTALPRRTASLAGLSEPSEALTAALQAEADARLADVRLASYDYPALTEILQNRPPPKIVSMAGRKLAMFKLANGMSHPSEFVDQLHQDTGVRFHGTHIELPNGRMVPTVKQDLHVSDLPGGHRDVYGYAHVATEQGNLHTISAHSYGAHPESNNIRTWTGDSPDGHAYFHTDPGTDRRYAGKTPYGIPSSPHEFGDHLGRMLDETPSPAQDRKEENSDWLKMWAEDRGKVRLNYDDQYRAASEGRNMVASHGMFEPSSGHYEPWRPPSQTR